MTLDDVLAHQTSAITLTYSPPLATVGGVAELPDAAQGPSQVAPSPGDSSDPLTPSYAILGGGIMAAALAVAAGAWYARRRRLR
jgi:hypothetical protein